MYVKYKVKKSGFIYNPLINQMSENIRMYILAICVRCDICREILSLEEIYNWLTVLSRHSLWDINWKMHRIMMKELYILTIISLALSIIQFSVFDYGLITSTPRNVKYIMNLQSNLWRETTLQGDHPETFFPKCDL